MPVTLPFHWHASFVASLCGLSTQEHRQPPQQSADKRLTPESDSEACRQTNYTTDWRFNRRTASDKRGIPERSDTETTCTLYQLTAESTMTNHRMGFTGSLQMTSSSSKLPKNFFVADAGSLLLSALRPPIVVVRPPILSTMSSILAAPS